MRSLREIEKEVSQAQTWPDVFSLMNELIEVLEKLGVVG
jgi:hypothetical protein